MNSFLIFIVFASIQKAREIGIRRILIGPVRYGSLDGSPGWFWSLLNEREEGVGGRRLNRGGFGPYLSILA